MTPHQVVRPAELEAGDRRSRRAGAGLLAENRSAHPDRGHADIRLYLSSTSRCITRCRIPREAQIQYDFCGIRQAATEHFAALPRGQLLRLRSRDPSPNASRERGGRLGCGAATTVSSSISRVLVLSRCSATMMPFWAWDPSATAASTNQFAGSEPGSGCKILAWDPVPAAGFLLPLLVCRVPNRCSRARWTGGPPHRPLMAAT